MDEREFSAIYESIEDDSTTDSEDMEEYVTVSEPNPYPGPYLRPEPKDPAPPPPPTTTPSEENRAKRPKLKLPFPSQADFTPPLSKTTTNPQLPPKPYAQKPSFRHAPPSHYKPARPPKPGSMLAGGSGTLSSKDKPAALPRKAKSSTPPGVQQHSRAYCPPPVQQQSHSTLPSPSLHTPPHSRPPLGLPPEEENQYDSISDTRKKLKIRRNYQKLKNAGETHTPNPSRTPGYTEGEEYIKMHTISSAKGSLAESSDDLVDTTTGSYQSRVVCIILAITVISLLIAVVSLVLALYSVVALNTLKNCSTSLEFSKDTEGEGNTTAPLRDVSVLPIRRFLL